jgi:predicted GIY-YIG superfamily endonuclease
MAFWVYILCCADGSYYTGHTDRPEEIGRVFSGFQKYLYQRQEAVA